MKERPILMSAPMVRATMRAKSPKTQTRRCVKAPRWAAEPLNVEGYDDGRFGALASVSGCFSDLPCPYGQPGDRLWVRETWRQSLDRLNKRLLVGYRADQDDDYFDVRESRPCDFPTIGWRPSIFMPRAFSRILLEITEVRVERVQDISEEDAIAEGIQSEYMIVGVNCNGGRHAEDQALRFFVHDTPDESDQFECAGDAFASLWDSINAKRGFGWDVNPFVWAISFRRIACP